MFNTWTCNTFKNIYIINNRWFVFRGVTEQSIHDKSAKFHENVILILSVRCLCVCATELVTVLGKHWEHTSLPLNCIMHYFSHKIQFLNCDTSHFKWFKAFIFIIIIFVSSMGASIFNVVFCQVNMKLWEGLKSNKKFYPRAIISNYLYSVHP